MNRKETKMKTTKSEIGNRIEIDRKNGDERKGERKRKRRGSEERMEKEKARGIGQHKERKR